MSRSESSFSLSRYTYVYPPDGDGVYGVGTVLECDYLTSGGATRIPWRDAPAAEELPKVRCLHLCPSPAQLRKPVLPTFLPDLPNLMSLALPTPLLHHLDAGGVPQCLPMLMLSHSHEYPVPAAPVRLDATLPGLRGLMFICSVVPPNLSDFVDALPALEFLHTNVSGQPSVLEQLGQLETLRHLELTDVRSLDIFEYLRSPLHALDLGGVGRNFPLEELSTLADVQVVRLNGVTGELDCAVFQSLPELTELIVLNSKRIRNVEALLDCPKLASIEFVNCANPFKRKGKALFKSKGFERLDIDYS